MNASVEDILRICGSQAVQIALLQEEVARLQAGQTKKDLKPLSDDDRKSIDEILDNG